jgi:ABC-type branched-subunit amino acid transport system substrate-binding protein
MRHGDTGRSRREVLKLAGVSSTIGIAGLAGCLGGDGGGGNGEGDYPSIGNFPVESDTATFGFTVPLTGPYQNEGKDELRAYKLAVDHLNNGGGWVDLWDDITGKGVLGKTIDYVQGDTATDPDTARRTASQMISRDNVIMFTGGSSSAVAVALEKLAQDEKVQFQCCLTHSNATTGKKCVRYGFRELFNGYMSAQALVPPVTKQLGDSRKFYQLYADYTWGQTVQKSMREFFEAAGWTQVASVATPLGTTDFSSYLADVAASDAEVLFVVEYGLDGSRCLKQAVAAGLDQQVEFVVPLYNQIMATNAKDAIPGVYGTIAWGAGIDNKPTRVFAEAFEKEYKRTPSGPAHTAYTQTFQYAAAVERAGTFYPPKVIKELEGYEYDNAGMGEETLRKCDHQAQRAVPVAKGRPVKEQEVGDLVKITNLTPRDKVGYPCDKGPAAACELGSYK